MERLRFEYSYKNIPIPSERNYKIQLIEKVEKFIKRMRWKAKFFDQADNEEIVQIPETYGLKTQKCPPQIRELIPFENDLIELITTVKFRYQHNQFQQKLKDDIHTINNTTTTLTFADKTTNLYKLSKAEYNKLLHNAITSNYEKSNVEVEREIISRGKSLVKNKNIFNRMLTNGKNDAFITLKDHKPNFQNNPKTRLLNPAKNELGRISKSILDKINKELKNNLQINQWKNTNEVIQWFKNIPQKETKTFTVFDIKDFYPSITENLLKKAISFAKQKTKISNEDIKIINHARQSLLFNNDEPWVKKGGQLFDVTMGAYDGAEVCELV
eukprot:TCONS_00019646-protein